MSRRFLLDSSSTVGTVNRLLQNTQIATGASTTKKVVRQASDVFEMADQQAADPGVARIPAVPNGEMLYVSTCGTASAGISRSIGPRSFS